MTHLVAYGRLVRDPDIHQGPKSRIATFSLACNVPGGKEQQVAFCEFKCFEPLATLVETLRKGDAAQAWAIPVTESWEDKSGAKKSKLVFWATAILPQGRGSSEPARSTAPAKTPTKTEEPSDSDDVPF